MGKGAFDGREDAYTGMVGMHGTKTSNYGITESDLLIAIGTRFSDRVLGNVKAFGLLYTSVITSQVLRLLQKIQRKQ